MKTRTIQRRRREARVTSKSFVVCLAVAAAGMLFGSSAAQAGPPFEDVTEAVGLKGLSGATAAWGDFNNDGWVDLYVGGQLWQNSQGRFQRVEGTPLSGSGIWGDFDNDGLLDLYCWAGGNRLFQNVDGKSFKDLTANIPKAPMPVSLGASWGDFDGDGLIDLYVGGYESPAYLTDVRYRNKGGGVFEEIWQTTGKRQPARGITTADFDEDGDLDVYVSNYRLEPNLLWQNDGNGKFADVSTPFGTAGDGGLGAWGHTIGSCFGDLDNDGHFDLFVGNFSHPPAYQDRAKFLRNRGPAGKFHFEDVTAKAGLHWQESYASAALGDYDNDGNLDLFFTTVYAGDRSVLYHNETNWKFSNQTAGSNVDRPQTYQGAWADFDNDGDLDLLTGARLFRNPGNGNHWLKVNLTGSGKSNRAAIGASVRIRLGERVLARQVETGTGQGNQNDLTLHFGLGKHADPVVMEIRWPDGSKQNLETAVDRVVAVTQPEAGRK